MSQTMKLQVRETAEGMMSVLKEQIFILATFVATIFSPVVPMVASVLLFIILDTVTGLVKANYVKESRNSNSMKRGLLPKLIIYTACILVVYIGDKYITNEFVRHYFLFDYLLTRVVALILIFIEIWSIDENFKAIFGKSLIDFFKKFINIFKDFLRKKLDNQSN
jgi:phage-related holin